MTYLLQRYKLIFLFFILLLIVGIYTFTELPQRDFPETPLNTVNISTSYPGAEPEAVESTVTNPIEESIKNFDGVEEFQSTSTNSFSSVILTLEDGVDTSSVVNELNQEIQRVSSSFPEDVQQPEVKENELSTPIFSFFFTADNREDLNEMYEHREEWQETIEDINGVQQAQFNGLENFEVAINLDNDEIQNNQLLLPDIISAIENEWYPSPAGEHQQDDTKFTLTIDHYEELDELGNTTVQNQSGESIELSEFASIDLQEAESPNLITYKGKPALNLTISLQSGEDIPSISEQVQSEVQPLADDLPDSIEFESYFSQSEFISGVFDSLFLSLAISVIAVVLITTLGLSLSGAIIVAISIPLSVVLGLIPLPFLCVDLNQISVIGAIIALGILVDDSIVMNDNIQRRYSLGDNAMQGAIKGIAEVRTSIITSTLAIVFTFSPLILLSGANGAFIRALPAVLISTIIASTIIALILVPSIRYFLYKKKSNKMSANPGILGKLFNKGSSLYADSILKKLIRKPKITASLGLVFATLLFGLIVWTPFEFFPAADREEVTIDVSLPNGATQDETFDLLQQIESDLIDEGSEVKDVSVFTGSSAPNLFTQPMNQSGDYTGRLIVRIDKNDISAVDYIEKWEGQLRDEYSNATIFMETIEQGPPSGAPLTVTIKGEDLDQLIEVRDRTMEELRNYDVDLVVDNVGELSQALVYDLNRDALQEFGVTAQSISQQFSIRTTGIPLQPITQDQNNYDVRLFVDRLSPGEQLPLEDMVVPTNTQQGPPVIAVDELVSVSEGEQIPLIYHEQGDRSLKIRAYADDTSTFESDIESFVAEENEEADGAYTLSTGAETDSQDSFFKEITVIFSVVILLVYLLIALQFNSLRMPFLILVSVYLGIAGAILGLFITQTPISFLAVTGMVSLTGIVVRNSLVLVDFIEQALKEGNSLSEAIIESGRARFRPIVLTALTSIVALLPVAIAGDVLFRPLAITVVSGILFSTIMTLLLVPVLYVLFKGKKVKNA
ncbi:AcrB/AcrD/AcrF family protein [Halalkalibacillus sediminis]|uniref:AcrB/AcrD/AcrF family protein n=1 Tax=Halalkalibacillus sediminis TaxID=2018042 RepID=A0A2I0QXV0_9BACI|nr:efflux RND transporter permease subunit [Halalkalibacillus sediminis]PKR78930.1 AcrB/AcrD/AcrF family protein [Halalkalibacillus sediminis]